MMRNPDLYLRRITAIAFLALPLLMATSNAFGTNRFFRDRTVKSPDGRYRLEAKSPDNAGARPKPFAKNFTYTLYDTDGERVLWKRKQPSDEGSPVAIFLHDELWVVIRTGRDELVSLEPVTGQKVVEIDILDEFPDTERESYVSRTTAGPKWSGNSRWFFLENDGDMHFVIRTWWDRRVIVNLTDAINVSRPGEELLKACDANDREFALQALDGALERTKPKEGKLDYDAVWEVSTAVNLTGRSNIHEAIPLLRELEESNYVGSSGGWFDMDGKYKDGDINPFNKFDATFRRAVHLALRRLGEKPREFPCTWFNYARPGSLREFVEVPALPVPRAERVDLVKSGAKPMDVLRAIGAPDYVNFGQEAWEYDMDTDEPYTFRVYWRDKSIVDRCEQITPAIWQQGDARYHQLNR